MRAEPSELASGVREGDVIAGKYRVDKVLGAGGMGVVVAAYHLQLDEKVALKFLLPEAMKNPDTVGRFAREARAAVKIKSEHVARVIDVGQLESGAPYMVMEYLDGGDLDAWVRERGALPVEQAVEFVLQACVAVADAHALGIVHRDLKPANLFCVRRSDGQLSIKVLDFGISKLTNADATDSPGALTKTSAQMGSPLYMSPEQMRSSKGVDARSDIWALGVILFELIAGRSPFLAETMMDLAVKIATQAPPPLRSFCADVPAGLEEVIARCLEKDVDNRYDNIGELARALLPFAPTRASSSVERIAGIVEAAGMSTRGLPQPSSTASPLTAPNAAGATLLPFARTALAPSRQLSATQITLLVALAIVAAGAYAIVGRSPSPHEGVQATTSTPPLHETAASTPLPAAAAVPQREVDPGPVATVTPTTRSAPPKAPELAATTHAPSLPATGKHLPPPPPPPPVVPTAAAPDDPLGKLQPKK